MALLRDMWQLELEIVRCPIPDLGAFEEALEGAFLILSKWYCFSGNRGIGRMRIALVPSARDERQRMRVIN